jgi:hypothetical protein
VSYTANMAFPRACAQLIEKEAHSNSLSSHDIGRAYYKEPTAASSGLYDAHPAVCRLSLWQALPQTTHTKTTRSCMHHASVAYAYPCKCTCPTNMVTTPSKQLAQTVFESMTQAHA